jgi:predicted enzyme related to lactoylglutathione lyase
VAATDHDGRKHMLDRDGYPPGVPCWVDTTPPDPHAAVAFYGPLFGWEFEDRTPTGSDDLSLVAQIRGRAVAGVRTPPHGVPPTAAWNTYISVESADEASAKTRAAGGRVVVEPFDVHNAGRMSVCSDPSGARFCVWQAKDLGGAQLVNEPGTWNFSELNTPDPDGARDFYGAVFGWELSGFDGDDGGSGFWRMPGYGDFLAQRDPDVRARQAEVGAPPGFEDAVAWLVPTGSTDPAPPHWSITFAVDDADEVARRAEELGGEIVAPPVDAPWVRMTVLRDPQGAAFTASVFVPPG